MFYSAVSVPAAICLAIALLGVTDLRGAAAETVFLTRRGGFDCPTLGVSGTVLVSWDGWKSSAEPNRLNFSEASCDLIDRRKAVVAKCQWTAACRSDDPAGTSGVSLSSTLTFQKSIEGATCVGARILLRHAEWQGGTWACDDGRSGLLPAERVRSRLFEGDIASLTLTRSDGRVLVVRLPQRTSIHISNDSAWCDCYSVRFIHRGDFAAGEVITDAFALSLDKGSLDYGGYYRLVAKADDEWIPIALKKCPVSGSVMDFSGMALADGPCGKYGRLTRVADHFEFENRPGEVVRLAGANLLGACCIFDDEEQMDEIVSRILASGYNAMRLHHIDCVAGILKDGTDPADAVIDEDKLDKLDRFVAKCFARGIYLTVDLFSLRTFSWRSMGIDREGNMGFQLAKAFAHLTDAGFESWRHYVEQLLNHVNPYTGRAWKDEPGIPLVCLVNEAGLTQSWASMQDCPLLAERLGMTCDELRDLRTNANPKFDQLCDRVERASFARMKSVTESLGLKALLTDLNNGPHPAVKNKFRAEALDYVDNHFYFDHPRWLGERLKLPAQQPMLEIGEYDGDSEQKVSPAFRASKHDFPNSPYTVTEWNFNAPNPTRSGGGLYMGAVAAAEKWDGLWRFTWAHVRQGLYENDNRLGFFDVMRDPIMFVNDRTFVALYLRGDGDNASLNWPSLDEKKSFTVDSPRTQGVYLSVAGRVATENLEVKSNGRCTVAATALDADAPLARARRILVTHLTDCVNEGMTWLDPSRTVISSYGTGPVLVRKGAADVALKLRPAARYEVWACGTDGKRLLKVESRQTSEGRLSFKARIRGDRPIALVYEVCMVDEK